MFIPLEWTPEDLAHVIEKRMLLRVPRKWVAAVETPDGGFRIYVFFELKAESKIEPGRLIPLKHLALLWLRKRPPTLDEEWAFAIREERWVLDRAIMAMAYDRVFIYAPSAVPSLEREKKERFMTPQAVLHAMNELVDALKRGELEEDERFREYPISLLCGTDMPRYLFDSDIAAMCLALLKEV